MQREEKKKIIQAFAQSQGDTGSAAVQVAILTNRINDLTEHLRSHPKDNHSRRGLLGLVGKRRRLLNYMKYNKKEQFEMVAEKLSLKK
jgi:small subunit ribosomal protein S15